MLTHHKVQTVSNNFIPQIKHHKIILFDLSIRGHHPAYIQHLIRYWCEQDLAGSLDIVVTPSFLHEHAELVNSSLVSNQENVRFTAITLKEEALLKPRNNAINRNLRAFQEWHLFCKYTELLEAEQCLVMYFDPYQLPLSLSLKKINCSFSAIYFRPTFHYNEFTKQISWKEHIQKWREKYILSRTINHPKLKTLFCLDPFAVNSLKKLKSRADILHLPDPVHVDVPPSFQSHQFKNELGISSDRQICLLFGALTERKGIYQLLEAISQLSPTVCDKLCLLLVGETPLEATLKSRIATLRESCSIQIIERYEFIPDQDIPAYFQLSDVVLAPYQRHVGMSGILLLAAAAQKPVLSSNYGLMGEIVRRYNLGITVDSTKPEEIAQGLTTFSLESSDKLCDRQQMKLFAEQNSAEKFARIIFQNI